MAAELEKKYTDITSWADLYRISTMEAKKMIVFQLIKQVRVQRDYHIEIDLNVGYEQFQELLGNRPMSSQEDESA